MHKKRTLVKLAAGMANQVAAQMAQQGPERAFKAFEGKGRALDAERHRSKELPVRKGRATKALPPVVAWRAQHKLAPR